jgi:hypothetical protein
LSDEIILFEEECEVGCCCRRCRVRWYVLPPWWPWVWFVIALVVWVLLAAAADLPVGVIASGAVLLAWLHLRDAYNLP